MLQIHWTSHTINDRVTNLIGPRDTRKLQWFGHVTRAKGTLANTILQGSAEGTRWCGRPRRWWLSDSKEWTGLELAELLRAAEDRQLETMIMIGLHA
jgi:hypothetical protein